MDPASVPEAAKQLGTDASKAIIRTENRVNDLHTKVDAVLTSTKFKDGLIAILILAVGFAIGFAFAHFG